MNTEQKIDKILETVNAQNVQIATFITHQKQQRKEIDEHSKHIDKLIEIKDKMLGVVITVSVCISGVVSLVTIFYKK